MSGRAALSKGERRLLWVTLGFIVLVGGVGCWMAWANSVPEVNIPTPTMPSPNAMDTYLAAYAKRVMALPASPSATHAPPTIDDVYECIEGGKIVARPRSWASSAPLPTLQELQALMRANAPALAALRVGFTQQYHARPARSAGATFPEVAKMRAIARWLQADGDVQCAAGDWDGGMASYLDILHIGTDIPRGSSLIGGLVGIAMQAIGRAEAWTALPHLSAPAARAGARRMEALLARQVPYADILQEELYAGQAMLLESMRKPNWQKEMLTGWSSTPPSPGIMAQAYLTGKRTVFDNYTHYMSKLVANAKHPYAARVAPPPIPKDPFNQVIAPVFGKARPKFTLCETQDALFTVALALQAYRAEHGAYPTTLAALVPGYLQAIPGDPYALKGPLQYRGGGNTYTLYSIGPDGKDDGGTPSLDGQRVVGPGGKTTYPTPLSRSSTGDIVAGVNVL